MLSLYGAPSDVYWDTTTDPTYGYPHMLYDSAYPRWHRVPDLNVPPGV